MCLLLLNIIKCEQEIKLKTNYTSCLFGVTNEVNILAMLF